MNMSTDNTKFDKVYETKETNDDDEDDKERRRDISYIYPLLLTSNNWSSTERKSYYPNTHQLSTYYNIDCWIQLQVAMYVASVMPYIFNSNVLL